MLVEELNGERLSDSLDGSRQRIRLNGKVLNVRVAPGMVMVTMDFGEGDPEVMKKVAAHLDAAIASGKYDALIRTLPTTETR